MRETCPAGLIPPRRARRILAPFFPGGTLGLRPAYSAGRKRRLRKPRGRGGWSGFYYGPRKQTPAPRWGVTDPRLRGATTTRLSRAMRWVALRRLVRDWGA